MSLTVAELVDSREYTEKYILRDGTPDLAPTLKCRYLVKGTDEPAIAGTASGLPAIGEQVVYGEYTLYVIDRSYQVRKSVSGASDNAVEVVITYGVPDMLPAEEDEVELSIVAETAHIEKAIAQTHYPSNKSGVGLMIGVNADGKVEGVDIYVPRGSLVCRTTRETLSAEYRATLMDLCGTVNDAEWGGWAKGEVLFLGAVARRRGSGDWRVEYHFAVSRNSEETVVTVKDDGTTEEQEIAKPGWHYLWMEKVRRKNSSGNGVDLLVQAAHLAQVYREADFSLLEG
ncbi:MAG: hypothetical protein N3A38_07635 [Planctomycetota bacterium]|nr:hypothetical protein [Planctomycetota bacterium]